MKRKFKLITSIASLTAAVALLAVGAFAAGSRNVDVSGTVSFTASNVEATVTVQEAYGANASAELTFATITAENAVQNFSAASEGNQTGKSVELGEIELDDNTLVYAFQIFVENKFPANGYQIEAVWEWEGTPVSGEGSISGVTIVLPEVVDQTKVISGGESATFMVKVIINPSLVPADLTINLDANVQLEIAK